MIIKQISLQNFRNYDKKTFEFSDGKNLITGPNAAGKTNLLEAIYLLATGKSFRANLEAEMISYGEELSRISAEIINSKDEKIALEIVLTTGEVMGQKAGKKKFLVNGVSRRMIDFLGNLRAVYFGPEDLELITDSPSLRRRYLDSVLVQVDREYARASLSYEKGLRSRNRILEEMRETGTIDRRRLFFWDQLLIKNGNIITSKREEFINFSNNCPPIIRNSLFNIQYDSSTISEERLSQYDREEIAAGATLVGPHRDDFAMQIRNLKLETRNLSAYGSRGEQRLAVLWMKLGELAFIEKKSGDKPVLLLDDIFSELDSEHRELVLKITDSQQTIITTADLNLIEKDWLSGVKMVELE